MRRGPLGAGGRSRGQRPRLEKGDKALGVVLLAKADEVGPPAGTGAGAAGGEPGAALERVDALVRLLRVEEQHPSPLHTAEHRPGFAKGDAV